MMMTVYNLSTNLGSLVYVCGHSSLYNTKIQSVMDVGHLVGTTATRTTAIRKKCLVHRSSLTLATRRSMGWVERQVNKKGMKNGIDRTFVIFKRTRSGKVERGIDGRLIVAHVFAFYVNKNVYHFYGAEFFIAARSAPFDVSLQRWRWRVPRDCAREF